MKDINFGLTDIFYSFLINNCFIGIFRKSQECFFDYVKILFVSGKIPNFKFSLVKPQKEIHPSTIKNIFKIYKENNLETLLICDKENIKEKELEDEFSNYVLENLSETKGKIFITSSVLKEYIKKEYKNIEIIDFKDYIQINPICENCEFYSLHKKVFEENLADLNYFPCPLKDDFNFYTTRRTEKPEENKNYLFCFSELIKTTTLNYSKLDILESYLYYLVKPEYRQEIRKQIINNAIINFRARQHG